VNIQYKDTLPIEEKKEARRKRREKLKRELEKEGKLTHYLH